MDATLPLDQPRSISFVDRGIPFTYKFRRITSADWLRFFVGIVYHTEEDGKGGRVQTFDMRTALQKLVEDTLVLVLGFRTPGDAPLDQVKDWKQKLPIGQKLNAGRLLKDVEVVTGKLEENPILGETMDVSLECTWSAGDNGKMTRYSGLVHRFQPPSIEQLRRYNRESSRSVVLGGSRTGKTIWPGTQSVLAHLYDDLIVSVDGYSSGGCELGSDREAIKREMDTYHKVAAVENLFVTSSDDGSEAKEESVE